MGTAPMAAGSLAALYSGVSVVIIVVTRLLRLILDLGSTLSFFYHVFGSWKGIWLAPSLFLIVWLLAHGRPYILSRLLVLVLGGRFKSDFGFRKFIFVFFHVV